MIHGVGLHRADEADLVGDPADMGHQFAHLDAGLAVRLKLVLRAEERRIRIDERRPVALEQAARGQRAVALGEFRFPVEEFEVAGGSRLEHVDDSLRLGREVRLARSERTRSRGGMAVTQQ